MIISALYRSCLWLIPFTLLGIKDLRPTVFLVGDSISVHYTPYLGQYLESMVIFERKQGDSLANKNLDIPSGSNGGDSRMVLAYLKAKIKDPEFNPDYFLLNCGLHDIKHHYVSGDIQVSLKEYEDNLIEIINLLKEKKGIKLIWIRTTPVIDSIHNTRSKSIKRYAADVLKYNQVADQVCKKNNIAVIDLFTFTEQLGSNRFIDHVHYDESTRKLQAAYIAGFIQHDLIK